MGVSLACPRPLVADVAGQGPPVVLLHGQPGTSADWSATVPLLTPRFLVIAPDRPGYGRTGGPAGDFDTNADAVAALLDRLGQRRVVVVGHSFGGGVALRLAQRHPDRVAGLVLVASISPDHPPGWGDRLLASGPGAAAASSLGRAGSRLLASGPVWRRLRATLPSSARQALAAILARSDPADVWRSFSVEQRAYVSGRSALARDLCRIGCPSVVLAGEDDRTVPLPVALALAEGLRDAAVVRVPDAGHLLPHEAPGEVAAAVASVASRAGWSGI